MDMIFRKMELEDIAQIVAIEEAYLFQLLGLQMPFTVS